jgi:hypothetical protein
MKNDSSTDQIAKRRSKGWGLVIVSVLTFFIYFIIGLNTSIEYFATKNIYLTGEDQSILGVLNLFMIIVSAFLLVLGLIIWLRSNRRNIDKTINLCTLCLEI